MSNKKITELPSATIPLGGTEKAEIIQAGLNCQVDVSEFGGAGHVIEDEGTPVTQRANLNFVGSGVAVTDVGGKTVVTISSSGLTASNFVTRETPSGTINGSNAIFTLANTPISGTEQVFLNGVLQALTTDYTISSATITMIPAPTTGDKLRVTYMK